MKKRIISALIMIIIFVPLLIIGKLPFYFLMAIIACLGLNELINLREKDDYKLPFLVKILSFLSLFYLVYLGNDFGNLYIGIDYKILSFFFFLFLFPTILIGNNDKYSYVDGFYLLGSTLFIGLSFSLIVMIRNYSLYTLIYLLLITIFTDTFALFCGKLFGNNKLCPKISPHKTIEGLIGGTVIGSISAVIFYIIFISTKVNLFSLITLTLLLSLTGQVGDLVFSFIKRKYKIKDFSNIIPGHGGILDRFDSLIFVVLIYMFFMEII